VGTGLLGVSLAQTLSLEAAGAATAPGRARSVLFVFLFGGPSQLETFDPKPAAPEGIRGPFRAIPSRTPGLLVCEKLPRLAALSDRYAVIRTVTHPQNDHNACHYLQTGHPMPAGPRGAAGVDALPIDWPAMGSVVEYLDQRAGGREFPSYVYLPNRLGNIQGYDRPGQDAGWLGKRYNAIATEIRKRDKQDNPYFRPCDDTELDFRLQGLAPVTGVTPERLDGRRRLLDRFDRRLAAYETAGVDSFDAARQKALSLVASSKVREAFDIRREPEALRDRYGRHLFGQTALMGRRMIEAGARFVTVLWDAPDGYSWDSHRNSQDVERHLLPGLDQSLSALLEDMRDRGLLDETLVVAVGEMGRTPKGNAQWGRDHWSFCFPALLAGAGVRGGALLGRSDEHSAYPVEDPVRPEDLSATVFHALGIDPHSRIPDPQDRPTTLVEGGQPLTQLFS
jgi:hypothetical protein